MIQKHGKRLILLNNWEENFLRITGKGSKVRIVPVGKTALNILQWYLKNSVEGYVPLTENISDAEAMINATNAYLADNIEPALLYTNGMTYYIVDIKHLGASKSLAEYGVVRNHVYQIAINSIKGYGSPIYNGLSFIVDPPLYPEEDEASYVAAKINVLSWKVVTQGVDIVK